MTQSFYADLENIVILSGAQYSRILNSTKEYSDAMGLMLYATDASYAETYIIQVNRKEDATSADTDWVTLQSGNPLADTPLPAAGKAVILQELVFSGSFRIKASGNVAATRTWKINKVYLS